MTEPKSDFLKAVVERGFLYQCTDMEALDELCGKESVTAYVGYDCTGTSLHVGHMVSIMLLRLFQKTGHKPIILMGGGTTMVGDPTGKDKGRVMLSEAEIAENMVGIKDCFAKYLTFGDGPTDAVMVNNADWLGNLQYIPFLRDFGPHFSINRMLTFDSVKSRLEREQPLSFLEFNYMVLQAYDFLELSRTHNCLLQMGGSDQWGNIVNGVELGRRVDSRTLYGLSVPLITTADGAKMGKTAAGAVWLNADMLSPYDFWQFWRNTSDDDVGKFLRLFTELPLDEIARLEKLSGQEINEAKIILANQTTTLCHGADAAADAAKTAADTFHEGGAGEGLPTIEIPLADLKAGIPAVVLLVQAGLAASKGEAKRLIKGNGARLNGETIAGEDQKITTSDIGDDGVIKLSAGKKRHALIKPQD